MNARLAGASARRRLKLAVIVVAVLFILMGYRLGKETIDLPEQLPGNVFLGKVIEGDDAAVFLEDLVPGTMGILRDVDYAKLGMYDGGVWLGLVSVNNCKILEKLASLMSNEKSVLTEPLKRVYPNGGTYYISIGKLDSSVHVMWCHKDTLIWLRVPAVAPRQVVEGLLQTYPPS